MSNITLYYVNKNGLHKLRNRTNLHGARKVLHRLAVFYVLHSDLDLVQLVQNVLHWFGTRQVEFTNRRIFFCGKKLRSCHSTIYWNRQKAFCTDSGTGSKARIITPVMLWFRFLMDLKSHKAESPSWSGSRAEIITHLVKSVSKVLGHTSQSQQRPHLSQDFWDRLYLKTCERNCCSQRGNFN